MTERQTTIAYRKRQYVRSCEKQFYKEKPCITRYQSHSKEWKYTV